MPGDDRPEDTARIEVPTSLRDRPDAPPRSVVTETQRLSRPRPFRPTLQSMGGLPTQIHFPEAGHVLGSARGQYEVTRALGKGAYGAVYEAFGPFDQRYALKLFVPASRPYVEVEADWRKEVDRLLLLRHPNVVYLHDAFEHEHLFFLALEWCACSLRDLLRGPMALENALEITRQILAALAYLHEAGIVHGDLHPGNVLVLGGDQPVVKLADFGISEDLRGRASTRPNVVHHAIMAPEVAAAGYTTRQSDLYQVGLLLYWMTTGTPALDPALPYPELLRHVSEGIPRARAEALGTPLGAIVAKLLRRRESFRYATAHEAWDDLRRLRHR